MSVYLQIFVWLSGCLVVGIFADGHLQILLLTTCRDVAVVVVVVEVVTDGGGALPVNDCLSFCQVG